MPVRCTTMTFSTQSVPSTSRARSTFIFSGVCLPPRKPSSAVMTSFDWLSTIRLARLSAEKPPKTTECTAPIRAQASIEIIASGTIGIYKVTRSPFVTPSLRMALPKRQTSACSSLNEMILCCEGWSPSQMMAGFNGWVSTWRSRQLTEILSTPSSNHLMRKSSRS